MKEHRDDRSRDAAGVQDVGVDPGKQTLTGAVQRRAADNVAPPVLQAKAAEAAQDPFDFGFVQKKEAVASGLEGTVKFFNSDKGFGFITSDLGEDIFVHISEIEAAGYRSLEEGQRVTFEIVEGRKGREARHVQIIGR